MTRPGIVRADTIDLQDHHSPSAQDHSKSHRGDPTTSASNSHGLAPHQAETIREVHDDIADEELRTPRISWTNGQGISDIHQYAEDLTSAVSSSLGPHDHDHDHDASMAQQEDALAIAQNGGVSSSDEGDLDGDGDDLDDDLMDKISSSPSIEDGESRPVAPRTWPRRVSSLPSSLRDEVLKAKALEMSCRVRPPTPYGGPREYTPNPITPPPLPPKSPATLPATPPKTPPRQVKHQCRHLQREPVQNDPLSGDESSGWVYDMTYDMTNDTTNDMTRERNRRKQKQKRRDYKHRPHDRGHEAGPSGPANPARDLEHSSPLMIPYEASLEDDDDTDLSMPEDPRYIDSGWAVQSLQDLEDIDFEFVYALHTFVATVEGQANATKGDTMVLLDDSNSYWWLVRVVKDSSIGYLPAEHIETPTERLARLNKHRNVDLSATMLGDQAVKEKQSFKSSIRRRRKTVTFAAPTYVDYSDIDYSTDEEDLDELFAGQTSIVQQAKDAEKQDASEKTTTTAEEEAAADESAKVEPLKPRSTKEVKIMEPKIETVEEEETRSSEEILLDAKPEGPSRSRNGTVRNTDSFFKDETVETKKITLTPNLLRDDNQPRPSTDSVTKDLKSRTSLDKLDKELMSDKEKKKLKEKEKKEKDKKPSAIRSFFSRKDKKRTSEDDDESIGKRSVDIVTESQSRESQSRDSESIEEQPSPERPQRNPSKLQKQMPRTEPSPTRKGSTGPPQKSATMELASYISESRINDVSNVPPASMRIVDPETQETQEIPSNQQPVKLQERAASAAAQRDEPTVKVLPRSASAASASRPSRAAKPQTRMDLDDMEISEVSDEEDIPQSKTSDVVDEEKKTERALRPQLPGAFPDSFESRATESTEDTIKAPQQERLSESPVQISPVNSHPPALDLDTSSQEGRSSEESESPELVHGEETPKDSSSTRSGKDWDDEKLRAFFDEGDHVRDLLVVVYDKTDVEPVGKDHPVVGGLFREQNAKLAEITTQLDNMLGDWLARKQRLRGAV